MKKTKNIYINGSYYTIYFRIPFFYYFICKENGKGNKFEVAIKEWKISHYTWRVL